MVLDELSFVKSTDMPESYKELKEKKDNPKFDAAAFRSKHQEIEAWLDKETKITWNNFKNATRLESLIKAFQSYGDLQSAVKCKEIYNRYALSIYLGDRMIWKRKSSL
jgi:hypothetical protein